MAHDGFRFVKATPVSMRNKKPPYVGVYWRRADGRYVLRNFSAKSGLMGVPAESSHVLEWMHAVEASVPGAPGVSYVPQHGVGVQVAVKAEPKLRGWVEMSPPVEAIHSGQKVSLNAKPKAGSEFEGWRYPDGRIVRGGPQLILDDQCQAGEYSAIFSHRKGNGKSGAQKTGGEEK